jgi:hypothetical protein
MKEELKLLNLLIKPYYSGDNIPLGILFCNGKEFTLIFQKGNNQEGFTFSSQKNVVTLEDILYASRAFSNFGSVFPESFEFCYYQNNIPAVLVIFK